MQQDSSLFKGVVIDEPMEHGEIARLDESNYIGNFVLGQLGVWDLLDWLRRSDFAW